MTRYARRVDANHAAIVGVFRQAGCTVLDTSRLGHDAPDLFVAGGRLSEVVACEIKNPHNHGGSRGLSDGQRAWLAAWPGRTAVLWSVEDAVKLAGGVDR